MVGKKFTFQIQEKVEFKYLEEFKENNKNAYVIFIIKKILKEVFICKSNTRLIERLCTQSIQLYYVVQCTIQRTV